MLKDLFYTVLIALQEIFNKIVFAFRELPAFKRKILLFLVISFVPMFLLMRYGTQLFLSLYYRQYQLVAKQSFNNPAPLFVDRVVIIPLGSGSYSAYVQVANQNLDLVTPNVPYEIQFYNSNNEQVTTVRGNFQLLADQKKYILVPRFNSPETIVLAKFIPGEIHWQKRFDVPKVSLSPSPASLSTQSGTDTLLVSGTVLNSSPYRLQTVHITFLLFDRSGKVISVNQRDEFAVRSGERRAYSQLFPGVDQTLVNRVVVTADTDSLDPNDLGPAENPGNAGSLGRPEVGR